MKTFLFFVIMYVLSLVIIKCINKLSIKLWDEDLIDWVGVIELYIPLYNIFVILLVFVVISVYELYDKYEDRFEDIINIDLIKEKLENLLK